MLTTYITSERPSRVAARLHVQFIIPVVYKVLGRACGVRGGGREHFDLGLGGPRCTWGRGSLLFLGPDRAVCSQNGQGRLAGGTSFLDGWGWGWRVGAAGRVHAGKQRVCAGPPAIFASARSRSHLFPGRAAPNWRVFRSAPALFPHIISLHRPQYTTSRQDSPDFAPPAIRNPSPSTTRAQLEKKENTMAPPPHTYIRPAAFYGSAMPPPARDGSTGALGEGWRERGLAWSGPAAAGPARRPRPAPHQTTTPALS